MLQHGVHIFYVINCKLFQKVLQTLYLPYLLSIVASIFYIIFNHLITERYTQANNV